MIHRRWFRRRKPQVDCREVGRVLQSYLDDNVEPGFAGKIAAHLDECKKCGLEASTYTEIKRSLGERRPKVDGEAIERLRSFGSKLTDGRTPGQ